MAYDSLHHYEPALHAAMICQAASAAFRDEPLPLGTWLPSLSAPEPPPSEPLSMEAGKAAMSKLRGV